MKTLGSFFFFLILCFHHSSTQVYPDGIRHIRADKRVNEWKTPGKKTIVRCAVNQRQVVIALTGGELVYFEMDPVRIKKTKQLYTCNLTRVLNIHLMLQIQI